MAAVKACADAGQTTSGLLIMDGCQYDIRAMPNTWAALHLGERQELAGALHAAWQKHRGRAWYGIISDGVRPVTKGWDRLLIAASEDRNFVSCSDRGWRGDSRMAGVLLVPGWIVEALGYWFPPGLVHLWTDDVWEHLGQALDNWVYVPAVEVEDHHFSRSPGPLKVDFDHPREFRGINYGRTDPANFRNWRHGREFTAAVERIKTAWLARTGKEWGHG